MFRDNRGVLRAKQLSGVDERRILGEALHFPLDDATFLRVHNYYFLIYLISLMPSVAFPVF